MEVLTVEDQSLPLASPVLDNMSASDISERTVTVFPHLPAELRRKIWRHTLPSARVILFPTRSVVTQNKPGVIERCRLINAPITLTIICREAESVLQSIYQKLLAVMPPDDSQSVEQNIEQSQPFVYIDYKFDTLCIEFWGGVPVMQSMVQAMTKVQHLGWHQYPIYHSEMNWPLFGSRLPSLKTFTIIPTYDLEAHDLENEWALVEMPHSVPTKCQLTPDGHGQYTMRKASKALKKHGNFVVGDCQANHLKARFESYFKDHAKLKSTSSESAVIAHRKTGSQQWYLSYWVDWVDEPSLTIDYARGHWHKEPILLGDGDVRSCSPALVGNDLTCGECSEQRWLSTNDAFWLNKVKDENPPPVET